MIATTTAESAPAQAAAWPPLTKALLLSRKLWTVFPDIRLSAGWLVTWLQEHALWQRARAAEVRALDDPLEAATANLEALQADFARALANDDRALATRCHRALRHWIAAAHQTHRNTETLAPTLLPTLPQTATAPMGDGK